MRFTKIDLGKLDWLIHHPQFRQHKIKTVMRVLLWELKRLGNKTVLVRFDGSDFVVDCRDGIGRVLFYFDGQIEQEIFRFLNGYLRPGFTVVDVGANIGIYAKFAAKRVAPDGLVYAFEPNPAVFPRLVRNTKTDNVQPMPYALGEGPGTITFKIAEDTAKCTTYLDENISSTIDVPSVSLDAFNEETMAGIAIDYLKIDVAGADFQVLRGAAKLLSDQKIRLVQIECLYDEREIRTFLMDHHYRLGEVLPDGTFAYLNHGEPRDPRANARAPINLFAHPPHVQLTAQ